MFYVNQPAKYHNSRPGGRLLFFGAGLTTVLLLAGCMDNPAQLTDGEALATATVLGCAPYGSYQHDRATTTPTPTGTWIAPTPTRTPTPTPPPHGCDYCTMVPKPTRTTSAWPAPITTCPPAPGQPTLTPAPRRAPASFPTLPPPTPLPALVGNTAPAILSNLPGESLPGGVATDPQSGGAYTIWSQLDPNFDNSPGNGIYLAVPNDATGGSVDIRTVNGPGTYRVYNAPAASTVAVAPDGTVYVAYSRSESDEAVAFLDERHSTNHGQTWSDPYTFPYHSATAGLGLIASLRLVVDAAGQPHLAAISKTGANDPDEPTNGVIDYYERLPDGQWLAQRHPVRGNGGRQSAVTLTTFPLADGITIRTVLLWVEDKRVYSAYKDGVGGTWSAPVLLADGMNPPDGIPDYTPGFASAPNSAIQVLGFTYDNQQWVYGLWSLYSTGRLCFVYSRDGGATWSAEDALAYHPIYHPLATAEPGSGPPVVWATVHTPNPIWDPAQERLLVVYQFCDRENGLCFPAYAYSRPGTVGSDWDGYTDPTHEPLRLFRATLAAVADNLVSTQAPLGPGGLAWLTWRGRVSSAETYSAGLSPTTLLSGGYQP